MMEVSKEIGGIIMRQGNSMDLATQARNEGMISLRESGLEKVRSGISSLEEINRVIKD